MPLTELLTLGVLAGAFIALDAFGCVALVVFADTLYVADRAVANTAVSIAESKLSLNFSEAFFRGILCNALVCLAVQKFS